MGFSFAKQAIGFFLTKRIEFLKESYKKYFLALLLPLPFTLHIRLSGCRKKLGVNYGQSLEMGT